MDARDHEFIVIIALFMLIGMCISLGLMWVAL